MLLAKYKLGLLWHDKFANGDTFTFEIEDGHNKDAQKVRILRIQVTMTPLDVRLLTAHIVHIIVQIYYTAGQPGNHRQPKE